MHKVYFSVALIWGLITVFLVPPFEVMDEQRHYVRAGAISEGVTNCVDGKLAISQRKLDLINYSDVARIAFKNGEKFSFSKVVNYREPKSSGSTLVYSNLCGALPLGHLVAAVGIKAGDLINNQLAGFYLGRIVNLLVSVTLVSLAIKIAPFAKKTVFFVGLVPTAVFFQASIGYDSLILASSLLYFAYFLNINKQKTINGKQIFTTAVVAVPFVLIKPVYLPLLLVILFAVLGKMGYRQRLFFAISSALILLLVFARVFGAFGSSSSLNKIETNTNLQEHYFLETESSVRKTLGFTYSSKYQAERLFSEPQHFVVSFANSVLVFFFGYIITMLGITGWGGFPLNPTVYPLVIFLAILLVGADFGKTKISKNLSLGLFAGSMLSIVLVFVSMYILDTPKDIKPSLILGVQGRYFLPLLLPLFLALQSLVKRKFFWLYAGRAKWLSAAILLLIILGTIESYIRRYYV